MKRNGKKETKGERSTGAPGIRNNPVTVGIAAILIIILALAMSNSVNAGVFNINNVTDLINAINLANDEVAHPGSDTIILAPGTYTLSAVIDDVVGVPSDGLPGITSEIVINGNGSIIERSDAVGTPEFRIFHVGSSGNLSLNDLSVRNGNPPLYGGGGILNQGILTITNSTISGNTTLSRGGFAVGGGGLLNEGILSITNSTISGNTNPGPEGRSGGGGIHNTGTLTMTNSTVSGNSALVGGGIWNLSGTLIMSNSTVTDNETTFCFLCGGGILNQVGTVRMRNSIVANQLSGDDCENFGTITSLGYNLDSDGSCNLTGTGDKPNNHNAKLDPLQNNGGPTQTHALLPDSDAIDMGDPEGCKDSDGNLLTTDQRGFIRPVNGGSGSARCDIGAIEFYPLVNDLVLGFVPEPQSFETTSDTSGCPSGFVGKFSFTATLAAKQGSPPLANLVVRVAQLSNGNLLQNGDSGPSGVGALLTIPTDLDPEYADGILTYPENIRNIPLVICLKSTTRFDFFVDVLGTIEQ